MNITIGQKSRLVSNPQNIGVEGYELGETYEVTDIRVRNGDTQIFLKGNIHAYFPHNFA